MALWKSKPLWDTAVGQGTGERDRDQGKNASRSHSCDRCDPEEGHSTRKGPAPEHAARQGTGTGVCIRKTVES